MDTIVTRRGTIVTDPPFVKKIFESKYAAWVWAVLRIWVGLQWVEAGSHKLENPAWTKTGEALLGFWQSIVAIPAEGRPPISFDWYRSFIQTMIDARAYSWFGPLVAYGETLVGIGLILGAFTGFAAFFGAFMNWNFMMAGSASINPMLFIISIGLIMAWKVAGYIGLDYFLLPWIGTPWGRKTTPASG
jgi:thiosulfate dehydrogenase [quinone] large subunit